MAASNLDKFLYGARKLSGQLDSSGIINDTVDNFGLGSGTGVPTVTGVEITIDRVDANGNKTPDKEEVICGVLDGDRIVNAVRGVEGTAQSHGSGAVWEIRLTASQWKKMIDGILVEHNQDGSHKTVFGENSEMSLVSALSADGKYSGIIEIGVAGATLSFGDLVYLDPTDSRWEKVDANAAAGADGDARGKIGICIQTAAADGNATAVLLWGKVRADAVFPTMTINAQMFASETAGAITGTMPTTADAVIRVIGFANTADELFFCPSSDYMVHV